MTTEGHDGDLQRALERKELLDAMLMAVKDPLPLVRSSITSSSRAEAVARISEYLGVSAYAAEHAAFCNLADCNKATIEDLQREQLRLEEEIATFERSV